MIWRSVNAVRHSATEAARDSPDQVSCVDLKLLHSHIHWKPLNSVYCDHSHRVNAEDSKIIHSLIQKGRNETTGVGGGEEGTLTSVVVSGRHERAAGWNSCHSSVVGYFMNPEGGKLR